MNKKREEIIGRPKKWGKLWLEKSNCEREIMIGFEVSDVIDLVGGFVWGILCWYIYEFMIFIFHVSFIKQPNIYKNIPSNTNKHDYLTSTFSSPNISLCLRVVSFK